MREKKLRGFFFQDSAEIISFYRADHIDGIVLNLTIFAEGVCDLDGAKRWALEALDRSDAMEEPFLRAVSVRLALPWLVLAGEFIEAIGAAIEAARIWKAEWS